MGAPPNDAALSLDSGAQGNRSSGELEREGVGVGVGVRVGVGWELCQIRPGTHSKVKTQAAILSNIDDE
jgi:hypothetical protein